MKKLIVLIPLLFASCAHTQMYRPNGPTRNNLQGAWTDCQVKAQIVVGNPRQFDFGYSGRYMDFMNQCMSGEGYAAVDK